MPSSRFRLSHHGYNRLRAALPRIEFALRSLDLPDRKSPLARALAGPLRRTIAEVRVLLGKSPVHLARSARPSDLFVAALDARAAIAGALRHHRGELNRHVYPRSAQDAELEDGDTE